MALPEPTTTSLAPPLDADDFQLPQARHLLRRAGFGPAPGEAERLVRLGLDKAVDELVDYQRIAGTGLTDPPIDSDVMRPPTMDERRTLRQARKLDNQAVLDAYRKQQLEMRREDRRMFADLQKWWLHRMVDTPRPMEEQLTLLWHSHFATRYRGVRDAYLMAQQNAFFRSRANRNFVGLAAGVVRDPAMIRFLNNDRNNRRSPNENLARELMELFTLGEGNYTEQDIKEAARALTGYHAYDNDFLFRIRAHDPTPKIILGQRDDFDGDQLVRHLLSQRACWQFVAFKLYRHFVADVGDVPADVPQSYIGVILEVAQHVHREEYEIRPVLKTLLKSRHFYDPHIVGHMIKSPAQLAIGTVRMLDAPPRNMGYVNQVMRMMGQELFNPPSVAGWDGGTMWINTSTLFARQNLCAYLITGRPPGRRKAAQSNDQSVLPRHYDPMRLLRDPEGDRALRNPEAATHAVIDALLGEHTPAARREPLVRFMKQRGGEVLPEDAARLLLLITAMPEYQLC